MKRFINSIIRFGNAFSRKLTYDHLSAHAAECAFFIFVSLFPFIMFLLALIQYLPFSQAELIDTIARFVPEAVMTVLIPLFDEIYSDGAIAIISVTAASAIWSASKGFYSMLMGLNAIYHIKDDRNYFLLKFLSILYTLFFAVFMIAVLAMTVLGSDLASAIRSEIPSFIEIPMLSGWLKYVVSAVILIGLALMLYVVIPNRKTKIKNQLPGAVLSGAGWIVFSLLYSVYINNMSNMTATYGSLTAIVLCMIWLYFCMYITFMGAELNMLIETTKKKSATIKAMMATGEETLQHEE